MYTLQSTKNVKVGDKLRVVKTTSKIAPLLSISQWFGKLKKDHYIVDKIINDNIVNIVDDSGLTYAYTIDQFVKVKEKK